ncbi:isoprenylcysteine carboxylmethyltransferase family protein [Marivirga harenae]|uniref:methyltransferase family protein n=1 Tax=Marivirga harenae TaxID=2010992 RepID=UPI0026DF9BAC|nr:isoprenylcysteine carboxylmethyltransferase family protein [Marivirga harenae]WKV13290.1 isoprenylcysteine carboxylmethyltransferase family protein [Marivirga harenae]|tara:strand:+ start:106138 stop:106716 length:579 start_codon:yes stop_codon:yes gene_type:complete
MIQYWEYLQVVIAWLIFGIAHSVLASSLVKEKVNLRPRSYRRLYNVISVFAVLFIFLLGSTIQPEFLFPKDQSSKAIGLIIATFGFLLAKLAFKPISFSEFLGIKSETNQKLITHGIYGRMRHPLYTALILGIVGFVVFSPTYTNLLHAICISFYLFIGIHYEERRLIAHFGKKYEDYKSKTPMLFPTFRRK